MDKLFFYKTSRVLCQLGLTIFYDFKAYGIRNVPRTGGVLMVSNHESYLDPVLIAARMPRIMAFMAKSELFENRYFGWLVRNLHGFPIRQGKGDVSALRETIARLQEGNILNIFPEGSRTWDGQMQKIQPGSALVIRKARVPVVPCMIVGSYESWPRKSKFPKLGPRLRVIYGPPMILHDLKPDEITRRIEHALRHLRDKLNDIIAREDRPWEFRSLSN